MLETCKQIIDPKGKDENIRAAKSFRDLFHVYISDHFGDIDGYINVLDKARTSKSSQEVSDIKFPYWGEGNGY